MKQINIYKDEVLTNQAQFSSQEDLEAWKSHHIEIGTFRFEAVEVPAKVSLDEEVIEESYVLPATHTYEIKDISEELEQARINTESQEYLNSTDWMILRELDSGVPCPLEIKQARQAARDRIVNG